MTFGKTPTIQLTISGKGRERSSTPIKEDMSKKEVQDLNKGTFFVFSLVFWIFTGEVRWTGTESQAYQTSRIDSIRKSEVKIYRPKELVN